MSVFLSLLLRLEQYMKIEASDTFGKENANNHQSNAQLLVGTSMVAIHSYDASFLGWQKESFRVE